MSDLWTSWTSDLFGFCVVTVTVVVLSTICLLACLRTAYTHTNPVLVYTYILRRVLVCLLLPPPAPRFRSLACLASSCKKVYLCSLFPTRHPPFSPIPTPTTPHSISIPITPRRNGWLAKAMDLFLRPKQRQTNNGPFSLHYGVGVRGLVRILVVPDSSFLPSLIRDHLFKSVELFFTCYIHTYLLLILPVRSVSIGLACIRIIHTYALYQKEFQTLQNQQYSRWISIRKKNFGFEFTCEFRIDPRRPCK